MTEINKVKVLKPMKVQSVNYCFQTRVTEGGHLAWQTKGERSPLLCSIYRYICFAAPYIVILALQHHILLCGTISFSFCSVEMYLLSLLYCTISIYPCFVAKYIYIFFLYWGPISFCLHLVATIFFCLWSLVCATISCNLCLLSIYTVASGSSSVSYFLFTGTIDCCLYFVAPCLVIFSHWRAKGFVKKNPRPNEILTKADYKVALYAFAFDYETSLIAWWHKI